MDAYMLTLPALNVIGMRDGSSQTLGNRTEADVGYWHLANIIADSGHVRFGG
jgi:hypothetical protein